MRIKKFFTDIKNGIVSGKDIELTPRELGLVLLFAAAAILLPLSKTGKLT
jgi:hypothetical protein